MGPRPQETYHHVALSAVFPIFSRHPSPSGWNAALPAAEWKPRCQEVALELAELYRAVPDVRLVELVPAVFARLDSELAFAELSELDPTSLARLRERGLTTWASLLPMVWNDLTDDIRLSPSAVQAILEAAVRVTFEVIGTGRAGRVLDGFASQVAGFLNGLSATERLILARRMSPFSEPATLAEIGESVGLTRERIRQLEVRLKSALQATFGVGKSRVVHLRSRDLRRRLGNAVEATSARFVSTVEDAVCDVPGEFRSEALALLAQIGDGILRDGDWLFSGQLASADRREIVREMLVEAPLSLGDLSERAGSLGIHDDQLFALLESHVSLLRTDDGVVDLTPPLAKIACRMLATKTSPLEFEQLWKVLQHKSNSQQSIRNALFAEPMLQRTARDKWALREWNLPEYQGIAESMALLIEQAGGSLKFEKLVKLMEEMFDARRGSVEVYVERPKFIRRSDGTVILRTDEPYQVRQSLEGLAHHRRSMDGHLVWRLRLDSEILRGSGRRVQEALADALGLRPGRERSFRVRDRDLKMNWRSSGPPTIGSLRELAGTLGGKEGDWLVLRFGPGNVIQAEVVTDGLIALNCEVAVAKLLGAPPTLIEDDPLEALAGELDVVAGSRRSIITRSLAELERQCEHDLVGILDSAER